MTQTSGRRRILIALLFASVAAVGVYAFLALRQPTVPAPEAIQAQEVGTEPVLVAARDLEPGATIAEGDVAVQQVAPEERQLGALTRAEDAVGRVAEAGLVAGEQVIGARLGDGAAGGPQTFARSVPVGMRAVSIVADEVSLVGGFVQPGDRVDVLGYWEIDVTAINIGGAAGLGGGEQAPAEGDGEGDEGAADGGTGGGGGGEEAEYTQYVSAYVVQDAEVMAVAQARTPGEAGLVEDAAEAEAPADPAAEAAAGVPPAAGPQPTTPPVVRPAAVSVTLLLTPEEANRVMLAENTTELPLRLALRSPGDDTTFAIGPNQLGEIPIGNLLGDADDPIDEFPAAALDAVAPLQITDASFLRRTLRVGEDLEFSVTVKNVSGETILAGEGGAPSGYSYDQNEAYDTLGFFERPGAFRIGLNAAGTSAQPFPYRWSIDRDLAPGESIVIAGAVRLTERTDGTRFWLGLIAEPDVVLQNGVAVTEVTATMATRVRIVTERTAVRIAPTTTAPTLVEPEPGTVLRVVGQQGSWYQVEIAGTSGWLEVTAVEAVDGDDLQPPPTARGATPIPAPAG